MGRKKRDLSLLQWRSSSFKYKNVDRTNIKKLNGKYFCYKHTSYRELLYNRQIRIVDTLNQHLYIKDDEKCPLYDAGIGKPNDFTNFNYMGD